MLIVFFYNISTHRGIGELEHLSHCSYTVIFAPVESSQPLVGLSAFRAKH